MPIIKIQKRDNPYVQIDKRLFENSNLSWKSKGIMGYLLSKPKDWTVRLSDLKNKSSDGKSACSSGIKELESEGYIFRQMSRSHNGTFSEQILNVYEVPPNKKTFKSHSKGIQPIVRNSETGLKETESTNRFSDTGKPTTGFAVCRKSNTTNNKPLTNKEKSKNNTSSTYNSPKDIFDRVISHWNNTFQEEVDLSDKLLINHINKAISAFSELELKEAIDNRSQASYYKETKPEFRDDPNCFFPYHKTIRKDLTRRSYKLISYEEKCQMEMQNVPGRFEIDPKKKDQKGQPMWRYQKR